MTKEELRAAFPLSAAIIDEYRAVFGPEVKVKWISENGRELGRKGPEGVPLSMAQPVTGKRRVVSAKPSSTGGRTTQ